METESVSKVSDSSPPDEEKGTPPKPEPKKTDSEPKTIIRDPSEVELKPGQELEIVPGINHYVLVPNKASIITCSSLTRSISRNCWHTKKENNVIWGERLEVVAGPPLWSLQN